MEMESEVQELILISAWSRTPASYGSVSVSLDVSSEQVLLFEAVHKKTQVVGVMSDWVCEYNNAGYIMVVAGEVCDKLVDWQGPSSPKGLMY